MSETCADCHEQIESYGPSADQWIHTTGMQARKGTCALNPYGHFHAHPTDPSAEVSS